MRAFASTRRGRPRTPRDDRDQGTPELQARRRKLTPGADPALAENPLSVLLARGLISAEQHAAGCRYERLYRHTVARREISFDRIYRRLGEATGRSTGGDHDGGDAERQAALRRRYRAAKADLLRAGIAAARAVEALAVFGEWPEPIRRVADPADSANDNLSRGAIRKIMLIRSGLDALQDGYRYSRHT